MRPKSPGFSGIFRTLRNPRIGVAVALILIAANYRCDCDCGPGVSNSSSPTRIHFEPFSQGGVPQQELKYTASLYVKGKLQVGNHWQSGVGHKEFNITCSPADGVAKTEIRVPIPPTATLLKLPTTGTFHSRFFEVFRLKAWAEPAATNPESQEEVSLFAEESRPAQPDRFVSGEAPLTVWVPHLRLTASDLQKSYSGNSLNRVTATYDVEVAYDGIELPYSFQARAWVRRETMLLEGSPDYGRIKEEIRSTGRSFSGEIISMSPYDSGSRSVQVVPAAGGRSARITVTATFPDVSSVGANLKVLGVHLNVGVEATRQDAYKLTRDWSNYIAPRQ